MFVILTTLTLSFAKGKWRKDPGDLPGATKATSLRPQILSNAAIAGCPIQAFFWLERAG